MYFATDGTHAAVVTRELGLVGKEGQTNAPYMKRWHADVGNMLSYVNERSVFARA
jgi:hypothetical protein